MPEFTKKVLKKGKYLVNSMDGKGGRHEEVFTSDRLRSFVNNFQKMRELGLLIPAPWKHDGSGPIKLEEVQNAKNNAGFWKRLFIDDDGDLAGVLDAPLEEDAKRIGTTVKEVSPLVQDYLDGTNNLYKDAIKHIALVTHPVQPGQEQEPFRKTEDSLTIAMSCYTSALADDMGGGTNSRDTTVKPDTMPNHASNATIAELLTALTAVGIVLPEDTTAANLVERLIVATKALKGRDDKQGEDGMGDGASGGLEQPTPIAMGLGTMSENKKLDKALEIASTATKTAYVNRVKALLSSGRISAKYAKEEFEPLLTGFQLSISDAGETSGDPVIEKLLKACEALPVGFGQTGGGMDTSPAKSQAGTPDLFGLSLHEEELPPGSLGDVALEGDELDKAVQTQLESAGYQFAK